MLQAGLTISLDIKDVAVLTFLCNAPVVLFIEVFKQKNYNVD